MEHEAHILIRVNLTTAVRNGDKRIYSPPRLIPLAATDVESGATQNISEASGGGLLNTHS